MSDLKYLTAYSIPVAAALGLFLRGPWAFFTPFFAFVLIPIAETLLPVNDTNLDPQTAESKAKNSFFDVLLYLNLPMVFGLVGYYLWSLTHPGYTTSELIGFTFSIGIVVGSNGINVAHELGHRTKVWERTLGKILLLPALYMHFYIEHNYGHHLHAATREDPASARYNQSVYSFWVSSMVGQYISAWKIQKDLLQRKDQGMISYSNDMLWYLFAQLAYLTIVYFAFGPLALLVAICIGVTSALLLETINYIEHYGLSRIKMASGRYERVSEIHSWNSNHVMGRIMLYELTRHSDHHHRANKKYQLLDCHQTSPQMPFGYPTSMVLSLLPPLWFYIMNKRIPPQMRS